MSLLDGFAGASPQFFRSPQPRRALCTFDIAHDTAAENRSTTTTAQLPDALEQEVCLLSPTTPRRVLFSCPSPSPSDSPATRRRSKHPLDRGMTTPAALRKSRRFFQDRDDDSIVCDDGDIDIESALMTPYSRAHRGRSLTSPTSDFDFGQKIGPAPGDENRHPNAAADTCLSPRGTTGKQRALSQTCLSPRFTSTANQTCLSPRSATTANMPLRCLSCPSPRSTMQTCLSPRATAKHPRPATPRSVAATTTSPTCGSPRPNNSSCSVATANAHVGANEDCSSADVPRLQAQAQAQLELLALLESRERDLSLSAEIGSALLQTTEELKTQLSDRTRELGLAETRIQNLEHANSVLAEKAAQAAQYLHQAEDETWGARRELAEVRAALEVAQTDKTHAADALARLTADHALLQQCAAVTKFDADAKAASAAAEIARSRFDSKNAVEEATKFKEENARLKDRVAQLESAEQRLGPHHENAALLRHQVATLREDLRLSEEAVELRDAQLRELQSLLAQHEARFLHSQIERAALQRQIAILTEQLENAAGHGAARRCLSVLDHHYDTRDKRSSTASVVGAAAAAAPAATTGLSYSPSHVLREADENAQLFSTTSSSLSSVLSASSGASVIADAVAAAEAGAEGEVGAATRLAGRRPLGPPSLRRSSASSPASHLVAVASPPGSQPAFSPKRVSWTPSRDWLAAAASGVFSPVSRPDLGSYVAARLSTDAASRAPLPPTTHTTNAPSGGAGATPGMPMSARCSLPAARCSLPAHPPPQLAKISLSPAPLASSRSASSPPQVQPQTQSVPTCSPVSHHHTVLPADPAAAPAAQLQPIFFSCAYSSSAPESARSNCTEDAAARPGAPHPLSGSSTTSAHSDLELEPDTARLEAAAAGGVAPSGGVALPTSPAELLDLLSDSRQRSNYLAARLGRSTRRNQWLLQDNERLREQLATLRAEYAALLQATRQRLDRMQEKNAKPCRYPVCIPRSWIPTSSKDLR